MIDNIALLIINLYQRYISPHKGYRCASGFHFDEPSCSASIKEIVLTYGLLGGRRKIKAQFHRCNTAANTMSSKRHKNKKRKRNKSKKNKKKSKDSYSWSEAACDASIQECGIKACSSW